MKRTTLFLACLATVMTATAQEPVKSILVSEKDSAYYSEQITLWMQETERQPQNEQAWRNLYQAARYLRWFTPQTIPDASRQHEELVEMVLDDMARAIPESYTYHWVMFREKNGGDGAYDHAEAALKCLPEQPEFEDYDVWTAYLMQRYDEERLADLCTRYYQSGLYSPSVLQYNYNDMQGMDEGGIYFGSGDAIVIPKIVLQYGKGVHRDKVIVCTPYVWIPEYREGLLKRLGIDPALYQCTMPQAAEDYDRQREDFINFIISHTHRPVYFSIHNPGQVNAPWQQNLYNEGLTLYYSPEKYDNFAVKRRNVEERYMLEYLLERFTPDNWTTADRIECNYAVVLADLLAYYRDHDAKRYAWLRRLLMCGIDHADISEERKNEFRNLLR